MLDNEALSTQNRNVIGREQWQLRREAVIVRREQWAKLDAEIETKPEGENCASVRTEITIWSGMVRRLSCRSWENSMRSDQTEDACEDPASRSAHTTKPAKEKKERRKNVV